MDKELALFHTYLFSLCVNAAAALATSTGNRQLKLTRRSWLPAEQYCQVEQASTEPRTNQLADWLNKSGNDRRITHCGLQQVLQLISISSVIERKEN